MLFEYIKKSLKKVIVLTFSIYVISTVFIISRAENYEWTVINNTVVTNSSAEGEGNEQVAKDELNLECESAILIEQNSRPSVIRKKCP